MSDKEFQITNIESLKVAAFDWDNTLAFSRPALISSINVVLKKYGLPQWEEVKKLRDSNLSFRDNFPRIFKEKAQDAYNYYKEIYKQTVGDLISAPPKALSLLRILKTRGINTVIVSNKDRTLLEYELPMLYDKFLFTRIICGHEAPQDKPSGEQLRYAVKDLVDNISPQNVWMIGDSPMDSACALACNALPIIIGQPLWTDENNIQHKSVVLKDFYQLYSLFAEE